MVQIKVVLLDGLKIIEWGFYLFKKAQLHISFKRDKVLWVLKLTSVVRYIVKCEFSTQSPSEYASESYLSMNTLILFYIVTLLWDCITISGSSIFILIAIAKRRDPEGAVQDPNPRPFLTGNFFYVCTILALGRSANNLYVGYTTSFESIITRKLRDPPN